MLAVCTLSYSIRLVDNILMLGLFTWFAYGESVFAETKQFVHLNVGNEGATLLEIKKSFSDVDNVLYDWTDSPSSDYCIWRGVTCDNVTFHIIAL